MHSLRLVVVDNSIKRSRFFVLWLRLSWNNFEAFEGKDSLQLNS